MADKKISQLPPADAVSATDLWEIDQSGTSKSATLVNIFNYGIPTFNIEQKTNKNIPNGYPGLDSSGKMLPGVLPSNIGATSLTAISVFTPNLSFVNASGLNITTSGNGSFAHVISPDFACTGALHFTPTSPNTFIDITSCEYYDYPVNWNDDLGLSVPSTLRLVKFGPFCGISVPGFAGTTHQTSTIRCNPNLPELFRPTNDLQFFGSYLQNGNVQIFLLFNIGSNGSLSINRFDFGDFVPGANLLFKGTNFFYLNI